MPNVPPKTLEGVPAARPLLEVTDLKQWTYCPRVVYYRYCLPRVRPITYSMEAGVQAHTDVAALEERRSLRAYGLADGERIFDVALKSPRLGLSGRVDLVIRTTTSAGLEAIVVDFKLSERNAGSHFKLQLAVYVLLVAEAWQVPVRRGFIYHIAERRAEPVPITAALLRKAETTIAAIHATIAGEAMPAPPANAARCVACEFRRFCTDMI